MIHVAFAIPKQEAMYRSMLYLHIYKSELDKTLDPKRSTSTYPWSKCKIASLLTFIPFRYFTDNIEVSNLLKHALLYIFTLYSSMFIAYRRSIYCSHCFSNAPRNVIGQNRQALTGHQLTEYHALTLPSTLDRRRSSCGLSADSSRG